LVAVKATKLLNLKLVMMHLVQLKFAENKKADVLLDYPSQLLVALWHLNQCTTGHHPDCYILLTKKGCDSSGDQKIKELRFNVGS